jgi:enamine deaminase RidA (YjgF/YER057c/UK114 family)
MARTAVASEQAPGALGPYSQAIVAGGLVFCSGMAGIDPRDRRDCGWDRSQDRAGAAEPRRCAQGRRIVDG